GRGQPSRGLTICKSTITSGYAERNQSGAAGVGKNSRVHGDRDCNAGIGDWREQRCFQSDQRAVGPAVAVWPTGEARVDLGAVRSSRARANSLFAAGISRFGKGVPKRDGTRGL